MKGRVPETGARATRGEVEVLIRIGATQDVVWLQRFPDLAAFEKAQEMMQSDAGYWKRIKCKSQYFI